MTSSLVGSEMCIRDRINGSEKPVIGLPAVIEGGRNGEDLSKTFVLKGVCLLYTSDAADDM
eukprot:2299652-Prorocentrum_lima.AAC.1